jgi:hypothetical protein
LPRPLPSTSFPIHYLPILSFDAKGLKAEAEEEEYDDILSGIESFKNIFRAVLSSDMLEKNSHVMNYPDNILAKN